MSTLSRLRLPDVAAAVLTLVFAIGCAAFVRQDTLATFADDSVSYLVMAQVFSPFRPASVAIAAAFPQEAVYPPLFPLVLALAGAAHDVAWAHVLTALILAACVPLVYLLGLRWLGSPGAAAAAVLLTVLLPSLWINAKGILSEPLFGVLLLGTICVLESGGAGWRRQAALALLLSALALTRTAALPLVAAYALWAVLQRAQLATARAQALIPALAAAVAYGAWLLLRPAETPDSYARILSEHGQGLRSSGDALAAAGASLLRQMNAVAEGWIGSLLIYWVEGRPARIALAAAIGGLALAGMVLRLRAGKADAWIVAAYLATYLIWPFYDQMGRFLFPLLPVLVLYAFLAAGRALEAAGRKAMIGHALLAALLLSLALPALAFIYQRARAPEPYVAITDWYRTPGLEDARARAEVHLSLMDDMDAIRRATRPGERVMWVVPAYPAPPAALSPERYRERVREAKPDYVFLSRYHPRDTLRDVAWQAGLKALSGHCTVIHARTHADGTTVVSMLMQCGMFR